MATTKKATTKKQPIGEDQIITLYMNSVLERHQVPKNVFLFCKDNTISESDFYIHFGSFDSVKQSIWVKFLENAVSTLEQDKAYAAYSNKNKLLSLYFTLFEILTLNRSYILFSLKDNPEGLKNLMDLKKIRNRFKGFVSDIIESNATDALPKTEKFTKPIFSEGAWIQFLFLLKFWMDDTSKGFEKTDIIIEKSVTTVVDLLDTKPLESLIDLGKFLWSERKS